MLTMTPPDVSAAPIGDAALLAGYVGGSQDAFEQLVGRYSRMVFSVSLRILKDSSAAEDATQATFIVLAQKARTLKGGSLAGWLFATAHNAARDLKRKTDVRIRHEQIARLNLPRSEGPDAWTQLEPVIDQALSGLPVPQRDAIILRYLNGMSEDDAARVAGCPPKTLRNRVLRGIETLRMRLNQRGALVSSMSLAALLTEHALVNVPVGLGKTLIGIGVEKSAASPMAITAADGVLKMMVMAKIKLALVAVLACTAVALPVGYFIKGEPAMVPRPLQNQTARQVDAPPNCANTEQVVLVERFDDLSAWAITDWKPADKFECSVEVNSCRSAPQALRLRYTFPNLPAFQDKDEWVVNSRSIEQRMSVPARATHVRLWIKTLSAQAKAKLDIHFYNAANQNWEAVVKLDALRPQWQPIEFSLARLSGYWDKDSGFLTGDKVPALSPEAIVKVVMGGNYADFDVLVDDFEFIDRTP